MTSPMSKVAVVALAALVLTVVFVSVAGGKDFQPGDLRVCAGKRCLPVRPQPVLNDISRFYYGRPASVRAKAPSRRAKYVELRFRNGYVTGIAAGLRFDRFLSFGVNLGQFGARVWYAIPARAAREIRRLAAQLHPRRLSRDLLARSR